MRHRDLETSAASGAPGLLTLAEAARSLRRSPRTLRSWRDRGLIRLVQLNNEGPLLVERAEVERIIGEARQAS